MKDVLNQTKTSFICVGTAYEVSLEEKVNSKGDECIMGNIVLRVPGGTQRFRVYSNKFNKAGKNAGKLNYLYNALVSAYKWNTEINGDGGEPTRVMLKGEFDINDYASTTSNRVVSSLDFRVRSITQRVPEDTEDGMIMEFDGICTMVVPEIKDEEETGRLMGQFMAVNYNGQVIPINFVVEAEGAELVANGDSEIEALCAGQTRTTVSMDVRHTTQGVAKAPVKKAVFSKSRGPKMVDTPREIVEYVLTSYDYEAVKEPEDEEEEENSVWINPKTVAEAIKQRNIHLEELEKSLKDGSAASHSGVQKKTSVVSSALNMAKSVSRPSTPISEDPFDGVNVDDVFGNLM